MTGVTIGVIHVKCSYVTCPEIWTVDATKYIHGVGDAAYVAGQEVGGSYTYPDLPCPRCSDPELHTLKEDD